jgi:hypothetical protein
MVGRSLLFKLFSFVFLFFLFLSLSPKLAYACPESNILRVRRLGSCQIVNCPTKDGTTPACQIDPVGTATCPSNQQIWGVNTAIDYVEGSPEYNQYSGNSCDSTIFYNNEENCNFPQSTPNSVQNQAAGYFCPDVGTCNQSKDGQNFSSDGKVKWLFTGACNTGAYSYCTGGSNMTCSQYGNTDVSSGTGPGTWCETWNCGYNCGNNFTCSLGYPGQYSGPANSAKSACDAACVPPAVPTATPTPLPTCPEGQTLNGLTYSCQSGSNCSTGYRSGKTCSPGSVCCYTGESTGCTCSDASVVPCNQSISSYSDCPSCTGTGTYCASGTCTASGCVVPTVPPAQYSVSCSGNTTMSVSGASCSGCAAGYDITSGGYAFQGADVPSSNTVVEGHSIQVSVNGVNQGSPKTCGSAPPPDSGGLNCIQCNCNNPNSWDEPKWRAGDAALNWPGCCNSDANMYPANAGSRCYQPGGGSSGPEGSTLVGRYINEATGQSIYADNVAKQVFHWVYNGTCILSGYYNGGVSCLQELSYGVGGMDYAVGTPPVTDPDNQSWLSIIAWPDGWQPVSYTNYQSMGRSCNAVYECVKSKPGVGEDNPCGMGCEECVERDPSCGAWSCSGGAGSAAQSSGDISWFVKGAYPQNTIPAPICNPGGSQPRIDITWRELRYDIAGTVRDDVNADNVCTSDPLYTTAFTVTNSQTTDITYPSSGSYSVNNLLAGASTTTLQAPVGYGVTSANAVSKTVGPDQTLNFCVSKFYNINPAPNATADIFIDYNHDGDWDAEDIAYTGGAVIDLSGKASASTTSDNTGKFWFFNLYAGNYTVTLNAPTGYKTSDIGCLDQATCAKNVTLGPDQNLSFAITPLYSIAGNIWNDFNKNTLKGIGEPNYTPESEDPDSIIEFRRVGSATPSQTTTRTGIYTSGETLIAGTYDVSFTNAPSEGWEITYQPGTPPTFRVNIGRPGDELECDTDILDSGVHNDADCDVGGNIANLNFGITDSIVWYHCEGGDCRVDEGIDNLIPAGAIAQCGGAYADIKSGRSDGSEASFTPGMLFTGADNARLGGGQASPNPYNWIVGGTTYPETFSPASTGIIRASYEYISTRVRQGGVTPTDLIGSCGGEEYDNCLLSATISNGIYKADESLVLNSATGTYRFPINKNFIILVDGDLTINTKILVPNGSTATFLVNGNITIDKTVGQAGAATRCTVPDERNEYSTGCDVEGFYAADGTITIEGNGADACATADLTDDDPRFNFAGSMVANAALGGGGIENERDLCGSNKECPTYTAVERPDFLLFAPDLLKFQNYIWQEIAP